MPVLSTVAAACARAWGFTAGDLFAGAALALDFDETTTLDARISFTRATSATYFDSSGVLQTASSGVARFDHRLESSVWVNKGLLIEEQRTNICLQSENFSTTWANVFTTETTDATTAPDGNTTADAILETADNNFHTVFQNISANMTSTNFTFSVYVKANGRSRGFLQVAGPTAPVPTFNVYFDVSTPEIFLTTTGNGATLVASAIEDVGNGWYRVSASGTTGQNGTHVFRVYLIESGTTASYLGDVTKGLYLWGAQLEAGAFPTSYIKTTTASVTRNADQAVMTSTDFTSWYNATEGTVFTQFSVPVINNIVTAYFPNASCIDDNSDNEAMRVSLNSKNSATSDEETFTAVIRDGGSAVATGNAALINLNGQTNKAAYVYKVNDFAFSGNGGTVATDTSLTLPTVNRLNIGSQPAFSTRYLGGHVAKFYFWNTRKSNTFLQSITG